ncbi:putative ankyrin repeat-containing domain, PGG domain, ankyrin repeat-containing domain superfamily [Helianthus debilis subsp. tardiflorus]
MNVIVTKDEDEGTNAELYNALSRGEDTKVFEICSGLTNGPFHILTIHNDTIFHMASFNKRNNLVVALLRSLHEGQFEKLTWINSSGNTILHETTTNNGTVEAAREMLCRAPSLLMMTNKLGETPLFHAARRGKIKIFKFLSDEVERAVQKGADLEMFLLRNDKSTILHVAILSQNFDLAIFITRRYPRLVAVKDGDGLTGLQLLACNPSAFDNGVGHSFLKRQIYNYIDCSLEKRSRVPMFEDIRKRKQRCESAKELARILVEKDKSWKATKSRLDKSRAKFHKYEGRASALEKRDVASAPDTPLLLATKSGCTDIVKEILNVYPQAVEHIDGDGRNILHVAIKYRRLEIIDTVINMAHSIRRLRGKIDKKGYSLLHMFSVQAKDSKPEDDIRNPALVLRDDLILFERISKVCTTSARLQLNFNEETAEQMLLAKTTQLRVDAKEWMKNTAENCSIVAVLIATVAFAAAYTVPGGPNQETGYPLLKNKPFFIVFALADALSLTFSLTSVIVFLSILTSSFRLNDFRYSLHNKLLLGLTVLILSVSMMMVAFAATLILTISSGQNWTNVFLYIISFFPVTVYGYSYIHLYKLLINAFCEKMWMLKEAIFPPCVNVAPPQADFTRLPTASSIP